MHTALRTSASVSNPSTNSPMMRSTRQGSVLVKLARRSAGWCGGKGGRRRSASVTAGRGEPLERCDMVVLDVIEEGGEAHVAGARIGNHAPLGKVPHGGRWVGQREHDDRRALGRIRRDLGRESGGPRAPDQIFGQRR